MRPISGNGSIAPEEVVPTVAVTKQGVFPVRRSSEMFRASASGRIAKSAFTSIDRRFATPNPATRIAFSMEEWAWVDV